MKDGDERKDCSKNQSVRVFFVEFKACYSLSMSHT